MLPVEIPYARFDRFGQQYGLSADAGVVPTTAEARILKQLQEDELRGDPGHSVEKKGKCD